MPPIIPEISPIKGIIGARRNAKYDFELYPHLWQQSRYSREMKKLKWNYVYFKEDNREKIPRNSGIYMFVVAPRYAYLRDHSYIFYVGQATDLHKRYGDYLEEEKGEDIEHDRERIVDFLNYFKGYIYFNYFLCQINELDKNEDYLVDHIYPWANTRHRKVAKARLQKQEEL